SMTLKDMIKRRIDGKRLRGSLITFCYVILLSSCILLGLIWLAAIYFVVFSNLENEILRALVFGITFGIALRIYLVSTALWNMSLVISILEEGINGFKALALSAYFSKGNERRWVVLMLVFFIWGQSLGLPCLYLGCFGTQCWILLQISLFCFGNVVKCIACVIYFHDCKIRILEKKVDEEIGRKVEAVHG
ncbi:hypothetical protein TorRG33x02_051620, partial [Trema orientale]